MRVGLKLLLLPAGLRFHAGIVFTRSKMARYPDKREIYHRSPYQISRLSEQKCGNTAPKTVKILNFGHKFVP